MTDDSSLDNITEAQADELYQKMNDWAVERVKTFPGSRNATTRDVEQTVNLAKFCFVFDDRDGINLEIEMYKNVLMMIDRESKKVVCHLMLSWTHPGEFLADNPTHLSSDLLDALVGRWRWIGLTAATLRAELPDWARATEFHQQVVEEYDEMHRFFVIENPNLDSEQKSMYDSVPDDHFR